MQSFCLGKISSDEIDVDRANDVKEKIINEKKNDAKMNCAVVADLFFLTFKFYLKLVMLLRGCLHL